MADSKLVRECDGSDYNPFKDDVQQFAVLQEIDHVLNEKCPEPIDSAIPAGEWGDDDHPCEEDDDRHGTQAPRESVGQRNQKIKDHKRADKRLKALILLKAQRDLKRHAMSYKGESGRELLEHLDTNFAHTSTTKIGQLIKLFLTEKLKHASEIRAFNIKKQDQLRELEQAGVQVHEAVAVVCYLENLSAEFATFRAVNMMKDELSLEAVMAAASDFAGSNAVVTYDEAPTMALLGSEEPPTWALALLGAASGSGSGDAKCANCHNGGHTKAECFKKGGGLSHLTNDQKTAWLAARRTKRRGAGGGSSGSCTDIGRMDSVEVEQAMLSLAQEQTARHKADSERVRALKRRRHDLASAGDTIGI